MNKILICGGAGYVGSALVPVLLEKGYEVTSLDLGWFGDNLPDGCAKVWKDAKDLVADDLTGYDVVVWLAGLSNDPQAGFDPRANFIENAAVPAYVAYLAKEAGVRRFIHGGSCSVYGAAANKIEYEDHHIPKPQFPYGVAKLQAETGIIPLVDAEFSVIGFRKGTISGYSPRMRFDLIVNSMVKDAILANVINVNNPEIWRPILSMHDAVEAYCRAIDCDQSISGIFNVAGRNMQVGYVAKEVKHTLTDYGLSTTINEKNDAEVRNYRVSTSKVEKALGLQLKQSVADIVHDIMTHDYGDMTDDRYYNIRVFKGLY